MEVFLYTLKNNQIKLRFENVNSISIREIKQKLQDQKGYDKSLIKIMKKKDETKELENNVKVSNNSNLYLKYSKYIKYSCQSMNKKSSGNFANYSIFGDDEKINQNSSSFKDIRNYKELNDYDYDYTIFQRQDTFDMNPQNDELFRQTLQNYSNNYRNLNENDNYDYNQRNNDIPSASNRNNLEFSLYNNNSDNDINTENNNNNKSNSNNNSNCNSNSNNNNNFIQGQYENNVIRGENDDVTYPDSVIQQIMDICLVSKERVISALKLYNGNMEMATDSILNGVI